MRFLASNAHQVFSKKQLIRQVWGGDSDWLGEATVTEHVRRIRTKLGRPDLIETVRGVGYRFRPPLDTAGPATARRSVSPNSTPRRARG